MKGVEKPAPAGPGSQTSPAQPAKPAIPEIDPAVEACVRSGYDLGDAARLLREQHPTLSYDERRSRP
jgi:hypothetical protein